MCSEFSVVVPTHDRADLLSATLECIINQTYRPSEIIVIDDGSADQTAAILKRYAASGVRSIRIKNSGPLVARNVGLRAARSELVAFCDSDDLWDTTFLLNARRLWKAAPNLKTAYSNFSIVRNGVWDRVTKFESAPSGFWQGVKHVGDDLAVFDQPFVERLIEFQPFFPSCMVVNRQAFLAVGAWDEGVSWVVGSDFATALLAAEGAMVGLMRRPLVGIRKHASNISGDTEKMNLGNACILEYVLSTRPSLQPLANQIQRSIASRRSDALAAAFARGDMTAVRHIYNLLPPDARSPNLRCKAAVASAPAQVAGQINELALKLGSAKSGLIAAFGAPALGVRIGASHLCQISRQFSSARPSTLT